MRDNESTEPFDAEPVDPIPTDPKARALWLAKNRNTGPAGTGPTSWSLGRRDGKASGK